MVRLGDPDTQSSLMPAPPVDIAALVDRHYAEAYRYARRLSGSASDADDLVQEAFLALQARGDQIRQMEGIRPWLFAVVRNAYFKQLRSPSQQKRQPWDDADEPTAHVGSANLPTEFDEEALQLALMELHEDFRTPLIHFYFRDLSYREIADSMQVPVGTIMSRISRGKTWLRNWLCSTRSGVRATANPGTET